MSARNSSRTAQFAAHLANLAAQVRAQAVQRREMQCRQCHAEGQDVEKLSGRRRSAAAEGVSGW